MNKFDIDILKEVEEITKKNGGDIIDAICHWCEQNEVDIETVASLVKKDSKLKAKIQLQAEELNFLPSSAKLPI